MRRLTASNPTNPTKLPSHQSLVNSGFSVSQASTAVQNSLGVRRARALHACVRLTPRCRGLPPLAGWGRPLHLGVRRAQIPHCRCAALRDVTVGKANSCLSPKNNQISNIPSTINSNPLSTDPFAPFAAMLSGTGGQPTAAQVSWSSGGWGRGSSSLSKNAAKMRPADADSTARPSRLLCVHETRRRSWRR